MIVAGKESGNVPALQFIAVTCNQVLLVEYVDLQALAIAELRRSVINGLMHCFW